MDRADGEGTRIEQLDLDGRNGERLPSPTINAHRVTLAGNDITNVNTAICVTVRDFEGPVPEDVVIEEDRIHYCGELPPTNRHHDTPGARSLLRVGGSRL